MEFEEYKEQHFSNYAVYTTYEEEPEEEQPSCFYIRIERWWVATSRSALRALLLNLSSKKDTKMVPVYASKSFGPPTKETVRKDVFY